MTSTSQVNGHHSLGRTYEVAQNLRLRCVGASTMWASFARFFAQCQIVHAGGTAAGDDPMLAGNGRYLGARLLGFPRDRELLRVAEEASDGVGGRRRFPRLSSSFRELSP